MAKTKNFADVLRRQIASDASLASAIQRERTRLRISQQILAFREQLKLTQAEFAKRVGMHQSAIARLEDASYTGHSIQTLERIAAALGKRIEVRFVDNSALAKSSASEPPARNGGPPVPRVVRSLKQARKSAKPPRR